MGNHSMIGGIPTMKSEKVMRVLICLVAGLCLSATAFATYTFPVNDDLESNPFAADWGMSGARVAWNTVQAASGAYSVCMFNDTGGWTQDTDRAFFDVSGVPQTGFVEVKWKAYFSEVPSGNKLYHMLFGDASHPANGIGDLMVVGVDSGVQVVDGEGNWISTGYTVPTDTWIQFCVLFDQDNGTYYLTVNDGGGDQELRTNKPLINAAARFGDGVDDRNFCVSYASWPSRYYIDDLEIKTGSPPGPTPTPTPGPDPTNYNSRTNFESDPFGAGGNWARVDNDSNVTWSMNQAGNGLYSLCLTNPSGVGDVPRASTELTGVPGTGIVKVQFDVYLVSTGGNVVQFGHFGNTVSQAGDGYKMVTLAFFPDGFLKVYNCSAWNDTGIANADLVGKWVNHKVLFDQDALTIDYTIDDGSGEQLLLDDLATCGTPLGDASYPHFTSIPFVGGSTYYIDSFILGDEPFIPVELSEFTLQ